MDKQTALRLAKQLTDEGVGVTYVALSEKQWESLQPLDLPTDSEDWFVICAGWVHQPLREIPPDFMLT